MAETAESMKPPSQEIGHGVGLAWTTGYPYDPSEFTTELTWPQNIAVYDRMRRQDAKAKSVYNAVTMPIRRSMWRLDPNGADPAHVLLIATDLGLEIEDDSIENPIIRRRRQTVDFLDHIRHSLLELVYGHMPFEIIGEIRADGLWHLTELGPRMPATLNKINIDRSGRLLSVDQYPSGAIGDTGPTLNIPASQLCFYAHEREGGLWQGNSIYRSAYKHWIIKDRLIRVDAFKHERNGMGIPVIIAPVGASDGQMQDLNRIASKIRAGEASGGALPNGADLKLKGVDGALPDTLASIRYHDEQIGEEALAQFLDLGSTETGSRALGSAFIDFFILALQATADEIANTFNEQVIEQWMDWNYGPDVPAPRLVPGDIGADYSITAEAIAALVTSGSLIPDDTLDKWLRDNYRMPDRDAGSSRNVKDTGGAVAPVTPAGYPAIASRRPFTYTPRRRAT